MDAFEHFEEDQCSWEHLNKLPPALRAEAVSIWAVNPDAPIAGLLIESGTALHPDVARHFEGQLPTAEQGICGIVPVDLARLVTHRHGGSKAVQHMQGLGDAEKGSMLVVVLTPNGLRFGHRLIWVPTADDPLEHGADFGGFTIMTSRNDELKILRGAVERAKENPTKPGRYFQRVVAEEQRADGNTFKRTKLYAVNLSSGDIVITESSEGMTYARMTIDVASIG